MSTLDERAAITAILQACKNPVIFDLGAYEGEDTQWMIAACTATPKVIMVEADPDNYKAIERRNLPALTFHGAVADRTGFSDFWLCSTPEGRGSGSIHPPTGELLKKKYNFYRTARSIPCFTLDYLFSGFDHIDLIWADLQGAEGDMIRGGQKALSRTHYLFMEAEKRILYDGQSSREELLAMLPSWTVIGDYDFNLLLRNENYV